MLLSLEQKIELLSMMTIPQKEISFKHTGKN